MTTVKPTLQLSDREIVRLAGVLWELGLELVERDDGDWEIVRREALEEEAS